jgi:protein SCO1/2
MTTTSRTPVVLVGLLALASLLTTALIVLNVIARHNGDADRPPVWYALPEFDLIDHGGRPFTLDAMKGRVSIVTFIFTRCQGPCPRITSALATLQMQLRDTPAWERMQLVSVSVDPEHDTPQVLAQYAGWAHAEPGRWFFVTGTRPDVWDLIVEGYKLPVGEATDNPAEPIFHSQKFALVDGHARVRGMYDALDTPARQAMLDDLARLIEELD